MVDTSIMCRKHLLGEHLECHMFVGALKKGKKLQGFYDNKLLDARSVNERHDIIVKEMLRRGYNHRTPLQQLDVEIIDDTPYVYISEDKNIITLLDRCSDCKKLFFSIATIL